MPLTKVPGPLGDEAATRSFGASVLSHGITGKTYFAAYSFDVKIEGKNVCRHLDLTTSNHSSYPGGTPPFPNAETMARLSPEQRTALERAKDKKCPCCGERDCPAAFNEGEEPLSMKEALGVDPSHNNYSPKRAGEYGRLRNMRDKACSCTEPTAVFPSAPCDVYREPDPTRTSAIAHKWGREVKAYRARWKETYGMPLKTSSQFLGELLSACPASEVAAMRAAMKQPKREQAGNPAAMKFKKFADKANKLERINHLTPKEYGGCPTNDGNLFPQQRLCPICQEIDQFMTDNW